MSCYRRFNGCFFLQAGDWGAKVSLEGRSGIRGISKRRQKGLRHCGEILLSYYFVIRDHIIIEKAKILWLIVF